MGIGSVIAGLVSGLAGTGYSIYQDQRDYNYKQNLQSEIFNREDTAIQRRMADLKAAGLNPNLAAGSSAGAGSVVGGSSSSVHFGGALDGLAAASQIAQVKANTENLRKQNELINQKIREQKYINTITANEMEISNDTTAMMRGYYGGDTDSALYKEFMYRLQNGKNSADILQKQNDWFNTEHAVDMVGNVVGDVTGLSNGTKGWYDTVNKRKGSSTVTESFRRGGYSRTETYRR